MNQYAFATFITNRSLYLKKNKFFLITKDLSQF